ncbi:MAG TPA: 30S ribosomal protein S20 [Flavipsychrobacter sp.]|jgi:small subunit ribosomal protein S20
MANHKSTRKSVRKNAARRDRNRYYGKTTRNAIRNLLTITDKKEATEQVSKVISLIDKLAKRNVIHKNKAANLKSGLVKKVAALA